MSLPEVSRASIFMTVSHIDSTKVRALESSRYGNINRWYSHFTFFSIFFPLYFFCSRQSESFANLVSWLRVSRTFCIFIITLYGTDTHKGAGRARVVALQNYLSLVVGILGRAVAWLLARWCCWLRPCKCPRVGGLATERVRANAWASQSRDN